MYKLQESPRLSAKLKNGTIVTPIATLRDEYGGISHIIKDDGCYVLLNGSDKSDFYSMVVHWYPEAVEALVEITNDKKPPQ